MYNLYSRRKKDAQGNPEVYIYMMIFHNLSGINFLL